MVFETALDNLKRAAAIARGRILGVVPKTYLPNYREYYEKRWFAPALAAGGPSAGAA